MFKVNNTNVAKILVNGVRTHFLKVKGVTVFDDKCFVDWSVTHQYSGNGDVWDSYLTVSSIQRADSTPESGGVEVQVTVTYDGQSGLYTRTYNYISPLSSVHIAAGSEGEIDGAVAVSIVVNGQQVHSFDFYSAYSTVSYNGRVEFYQD